jgi:hypothetical protein
MKTRTKIEKVESVTARAEVTDPQSAHIYQETVSLLLRWRDSRDFDLLSELRCRNRSSRRAHDPRQKTKAKPIDMSDMFDERAEFVRMVNRIHDRLRSAPLVREWTAAAVEIKPRESETARILRGRFGIVK